jgi:outer membrane protein OmpA-like peptidoglycan-associated protein
MTNEYLLKCSSCGAQQGYVPNQQILKCEFCGSETEIPRPDTEVVQAHEADQIVPMLIDKNSVEKATFGYMASGAFTPDDIVNKAVIVSQRLYYVPSYLYFGSYHAHWSASFGFDREEHYTVYETRTNNGHTYKEPVTKTKTVTDWRPVSGNDTGSFTVQVYAGRKLDVKAAGLIESTSLKGKITEFKSEYTVGFEVEEFELNELDAYESSAKSRINRIIDSSVRSHAQGNHQKDWNWNAEINKQSSTVIMPIAKCVFEYESKAYTVWFDGSDITSVAGDELPVDHSRKNAVLLGYAPMIVGALAGILVIATLDFSSVAWYAISALALGYGFAYLRKQEIINHSKAVRNSSLTQLLGASQNTSNLSDEERSVLATSYVPPPRPFLADRRKDIFVLPIVSLILAAVGAYPLLNMSFNSTSGIDQIVRSNVPTTSQYPAAQAPVPAAGTNRPMPPVSNLRPTEPPRQDNSTEAARREAEDAQRRVEVEREQRERVLRAQQLADAQRQREIEAQRQYEMESRQKEAGLQNQASQWLKRLDGNWFSKQWKYGYQLKDGVGTATSTNSQNFQVGQKIIQLTATSASTFKGQQVYTDGKFYNINVSLQPDGRLYFEGEKNAKWYMEKVKDKVNAKVDLFFAVDQTVITPEGKNLLDQVAAFARKIDLDSIVLNGYSAFIDSEAVSLEISRGRVMSAKAYLVSQGIDANRILVDAKGIQSAVGDNNTAAGRAKNNRVNIDIVGYKKD